MKFYRSIEEYNALIGIDAPRLAGCDVRSFRENMPCVNMQQEAFRHNLFAIAWLVKGTNREVMGAPLESNVFFNAPYQIVTWDIDSDWDGYYAVFDEAFAREHLHVLTPTREWPFFRDASNAPLDLPAGQTAWFALTFERLHAEALAGPPGTGDCNVCGAFLHALLDVAAVHYEEGDPATEPTPKLARSSSKAQLVNRLHDEALLDLVEGRGRRSASDYADVFAMSTGHLNDVVREVTGQSTSELLAGIALAEAKRLLRRTDLRISAIADQLGYSAPTHFNAFFRKAEGVSASAWRKAL